MNNRLIHCLIYVIVGLSLLGLDCLVPSAGASAPSTARASEPSSGPTEHVILFVLEGFGQDSLKGGTMPTLAKLVKDGSSTWSATGVNPALRLPTMATRPGRRCCCGRERSGRGRVGRGWLRL